MNDVRRDDDHRARFDRLAGQIVPTDRSPANSSNRGIAAVGLSMTSLNQAIGQTVRDVREFAIGLALDAPALLGRL
jgi:hypothetical protein